MIAPHSAPPTDASIADPSGVQPPASAPGAGMVSMAPGLRETVGADCLNGLVAGLVSLIGQGVEVFEADGTLAAEAPGSDYCRHLKEAGRALAARGLPDPCRACCWDGAAAPALADASPRDSVPSACGMALHALPIPGETAPRGVLVLCHGTPPTDPAALTAIAGTFQIAPDPLAALAQASGAAGEPVSVDPETVHAQARVVVDLISRLDKAEATRRALKDSEVTYKRLVESRADLVVETDAAGVVTYVSPSYCDAVGLAAEGLVGHPLQPNAVPQDLPIVAATLRTVAEPPHKAQGEVRVLTTAGPRWTQWRCTGVLDDAGEVCRILAFGRDVHDRKMAEEALKASERRFQALFQDASWSMILVNMQAVIVDANPFFCALLGYEREEVVGRPIGDLSIDHEDRCRRAGGTPDNPLSFPQMTFETQVRCKDGRLVPLRVSRCLVGEGDDRVILALAQDISDRKQAQKALRETAMILEEAQRVGGVGHAVYRPGDGTWMCSPVMREILGIETEDPLPTALLIDLAHPDDRIDVQDAVQDLVAGDETAFLDHVLRATRVDDGETRWIHARARAWTPEVGRPAMVIGTVFDVTALKQAETRLERAVEALARSNRDLEQFASIASHDLQEPLRSIIAYSQLLERRYRAILDETGEEFLTFIIQAGQRMRLLIDDLLEFSRVSSKARPFADVDLNTVLDEVRVTLKARIVETDATVTVDPLPTMVGDGVQLASVFQNLIGNALKFRHPARKPQVRVTARRCQSPDRPGWELRVADNGIGVPEEARDAVFEVFTRLHSQQEVPGTGIGLAVVKRIAERHGGRVRVEDTPGGGATFVLTLPDDMSEA